jgi:hypothetical protein
MTWVIKENAGDEYLVRFERGLYEWEDRDWCQDQGFAYRFADRNSAAIVARALYGKRACRVVKLTALHKGESDG